MSTCNGFFESRYHSLAVFGRSLNTRSHDNRGGRKHDVYRTHARVTIAKHFDPHTETCCEKTDAHLTTVVTTKR